MGVPAGGLLAQGLAFGVPITYALIRRAGFTTAEIGEGLKRTARPALALSGFTVVFLAMVPPAADWFDFCTKAAVFGVVAAGMAALLDRRLFLLILRRRSLESL
jgi:hypothetical protein